MADQPQQPEEESPPEERSLSRTTTGESLSQEQFVVRAFLLADYAEVPPNNKLYVAGGGISTIGMAQIPGPLPSLYAVARVAVPYRLSSEQHIVTLRALDADRQPVVHDPLLSTPMETGRPPGYRPGDEMCIQLVLGIMGMPIQKAGTIYFHLEVNGQLLAVLPLKIIAIQVPQLVSGPAV